MSDSDNTTPASPPDAPSEQAVRTVDPFTVLFNAVEIANRRGAYSLKESAMISRALDVLRAGQVQAAPPSDPNAEAAEATEATETAETEAAEEPTIQAAS